MKLPLYDVRRCSHDNAEKCTENKFVNLQHLNPAKAIGEIKMLLMGMKQKPAPVKATA